MAHPDLEKILELLLDSARSTLVAAGEFLPFAAVVDSQGRLSLLEAEPPEEEELDVPIFVEALRQGIRRAVSTGDVVAAGVCANVHVRLPSSDESGGAGSSDAISAELERESECFDVFQPYLSSAAREIEFSEPFAVPGQQRLWPGPPN